jgi:hypothetical protein
MTSTSKLLFASRLVHMSTPPIATGTEPERCRRLKGTPNSLGPSKTVPKTRPPARSLATRGGQGRSRGQVLPRASPIVRRFNVTRWPSPKARSVLDVEHSGIVRSSVPCNEQNFSPRVMLGPDDPDISPQSGVSMFQVKSVPFI